MEVLRFARALVAPGRDRAAAGRPASPGRPSPGRRGSAVGAAGLPRRRRRAAGRGGRRVVPAGRRCSTATGTLAGPAAHAGRGRRPARRIDLPPESFASGPVRGVVLVGDDDGARSRLRRARSAARLRDDARHRGLRGPQRRVRAGPRLRPSSIGSIGRRRADLGVWRRATRGGTPVRLLPGLARTSRTGGRSRRTCAGRRTAAWRSRRAASSPAGRASSTRPPAFVQSTERTGRSWVSRTRG